VRASAFPDPAASPPRYTPRMAATYTYEVLDAPVLAASALRREPLLDPFVCGVREVEAPVVAVRVTLLDAAGAPREVLDAAFYPQTGEFGVTTSGGASGASWVPAQSIEDGIERWLASMRAVEARHAR